MNHPLDTDGAAAFPAGGAAFRIVCAAVLALLLSPAVTASQPAAKKPAGWKDGKTLTVKEPVSAGDGTFVYYRTLLSLGGPIPVEFTLFYKSDNFSFYHDGRKQFSRTHSYFTSNTVIRLVEFEDLNVSPSQYYATIQLFDDLLAFRRVGKSDWEAVGPLRYQLRDLNGCFYLMDPSKNLVYIFRSRVLDSDWDDYIVRRTGEVVTVLDRNENRLSFTYNDDLLPVSVEDGLGRGLTLAYHDDPDVDYRNLESVTDSYGRTVTFAAGEIPGCGYPSNNFLQGFTDAMGRTTAFDFHLLAVNSCNNLSRIVRPEGNSHIDQTFARNPHYTVAVESQRDAYEHETAFTYAEGPDGNLDVTVHHPGGLQRSFRHEDARYPLSVTDESGREFAYGYDADNRLTAVHDRQGETTQIAYHGPTGKVATLVDADGGALRIEYTPREQTFTNPGRKDQVAFTFYDVTRIVYPDGGEETFEYDTRGNCTKRTDPEGGVRRYEYDGSGRLIKAINPAGGEIGHTYNPDATPATSTDSDLGTTQFAYDPYKRLQQIVHPDGSSVHIDYDLDGRVTRITDELGNETHYAYDRNGNLTDVVDPAGSTTEYAYDLMDRVAETTDRLDHTATVTYDAMNRLASRTDPSGVRADVGYDDRGLPDRLTVDGRTWRRTYDEEGIPLSDTSPMGYETRYRTNALGHVTGIENPLSQTVGFTRDAMSRIVEKTDPAGSTTAYEYDGRGRLTGISVPSLGQCAYGRDALGNVSAITDWNGNDWTFERSPMGRPTALTDPLDRRREYTYDGRGRLQNTSYPDGETLDRTRDDCGYVTRRAYSGGPTLDYAYDPLHRFLATEGLALTRDAEGNVMATEQQGRVFGAIFDEAGRLRTATYGGMFTVTYAYEAATGLLTSVTDGLTGAHVDFAYDDDRRLTRMERSNGVDTHLEWDAASRLTRIQDGDFIDCAYTLDAAGRVVQTESTVPLDPIDLLEPRTDRFEYDAASQIASAGYACDPRGRQTLSPGHTFGWDGASRLTALDADTLGYNGMGNLVTQEGGGNDAGFFYNYAVGLHPVVAERDLQSGLYTRFYVWTPFGQLLYTIDASSQYAVSFYHFDRTGTTLALTDASGRVTDAYAHTPYGELLAHQGDSGQPFTFAGQWGVRAMDEAGSLYHMRARVYDAETARFLSRDPAWPALHIPRALNPYQYALADPLGFIDPEGTQEVLRPCSPSQLAGGRRFFGDPHLTYRPDVLTLDPIEVMRGGDVMDPARRAMYEKDLAELDRGIERAKEGPGENNFEPGLGYEDRLEMQRYETGEAEARWARFKAGRREGGFLHYMGRKIALVKGLWVAVGKGWMFFPNVKKVDLSSPNVATITTEDGIPLFLGGILDYGYGLGPASGVPILP